MQTWVHWNERHEIADRAASSGAALSLLLWMPYNVLCRRDSGKEPTGGNRYGKAFPSHAQRTNRDRKSPQGQSKLFGDRGKPRKRSVHNF